MRYIVQWQGQRWGPFTSPDAAKQFIRIVLHGNGVVLPLLDPYAAAMRTLATAKGGGDQPADGTTV